MDDLKQHIKELEKKGHINNNEQPIKCLKRDKDGLDVVDEFYYEYMLKESIFKCQNCGEILGEFEVHTEYFKLLETNDKLGSLGGFVCTKCILKESGVKKLYHVSNRCDTISSFVPRVPENRAEHEDKLTPRVSLSSSIEGALSATPWGGSNLENRIWEDGSYLFRVYEFDIESLNIDNLLPPEYLYYKDLVRDAYVTNEYWAINDAIIPSRSYLIDLEYYDVSWPDLIKCDEYINGLNSEANGEEVKWTDMINGFVTEIHGIEYVKVLDKNRSGLFKLNHQLINFSEDNLDSIEKDIIEVYPEIGTWIDFEERNGELYIVGNIETRNIGEINKEKMIDFLNYTISSGEIVA